jgi:hypothetical protein
LRQRIRKGASGMGDALRLNVLATVVALIFICAILLGAF